MDDDLFGFDPEAAKEAKREGMERAALGANEKWKVAMSAAVIETARNMKRFTTDDVYITFYRNNADAPPTTRDDRALGPIMSAAAREGICAKTREWRQSIRVSRHKTDLRIWRSLILDPMVPVDSSPMAAPAPTNARFDEKGRFIHDKCAYEGCNRDAPLSVGAFVNKGILGMWYCKEHWPGNRNAT